MMRITTHFALTLFLSLIIQDTNGAHVKSMKSALVFEIMHDILDRSKFCMNQTFYGLFAQFKVCTDENSNSFCFDLFYFGYNLKH